VLATTRHVLTTPRVQVLKARYEELRLFRFPQKSWFSTFASATGALCCVCES